MQNNFQRYPINLDTITFHHILPSLFHHHIVTISRTKNQKKKKRKKNHNYIPTKASIILLYNFYPSLWFTFIFSSDHSSILIPLQSFFFFFFATPTCRYKHLNKIFVYYVTFSDRLLFA